MSPMAEVETQPSWAKHGLCHRPEYQDTNDLFFADTALERRPARNLCMQCPVRRQCLLTALENQEIWGVWGGCDEAEIRRALWVDANGSPKERCRFPHCPYCHSRPSRLVVVGVCELRTGRRKENVECTACGFAWAAQTSVWAVKSYWRQRQQERRLRAKAPRGRVPSRPPLRVVPMATVDAGRHEAEERPALVASGGR